jgi:hypothetical protein
MLGRYQVFTRSQKRRAISGIHKISEATQERDIERICPFRGPPTGIAGAVIGT